MSPNLSVRSVHRTSKYNNDDNTKERIPTTAPKTAITRTLRYHGCKGEKRKKSGPSAALVRDLWWCWWNVGAATVDLEGESDCGGRTSVVAART